MDVCSPAFLEGEGEEEAGGKGEGGRERRSRAEHLAQILPGACLPGQPLRGRVQVGTEDAIVLLGRAAAGHLHGRVTLLRVPHHRGAQHVGTGTRLERALNEGWGREWEGVAHTKVTGMSGGKTGVTERKEQQQEKKPRRKTETSCKGWR